MSKLIERKYTDDGNNYRYKHKLRVEEGGRRCSAKNNITGDTSTDSGDCAKHSHAEKVKPLVYTCKRARKGKCNGTENFDSRRKNS